MATTDEIVTADSKFDPTTPFGTWDSVAKEFENTTDTLIFNYAEMSPAYAAYHDRLNGSPSPVSGDTLSRFKDSKRDNPRLKSHRKPTGYSEQ